MLRANLRKDAVSHSVLPPPRANAGLRESEQKRQYNEKNPGTHGAF